MANAVIMPKAGITVESCIIGEWKKKVGDPVKMGEILFTYETDKASFECESTAEGTLLEIFYEEGDEVPCLMNVCAVGNPGEDASSLKGVSGGSAAPAAEAPAAAAPAAAPCDAQAVIMPKAGITVESCIIGEWVKKVGDAVKVGDILFTYETDKASFECESTAEGTLLEIFYEEGDEVPCLMNVCAIGKPGTDCSALKGVSGGNPAPAAEAPAAAAPTAAAAVCCDAQAIIMPKAGITVESCIIGEWVKKVGDAVKVGDILFTYETDKASFECESTAEGTLLDIFYEEGEEVPCLMNVCAVGKPGTDCSALKGMSGGNAAAVAAPAEAAPAAATAVSPRARNLAKAEGVDAAQATGTGPNGRVIERDVKTLIANRPAAAAVAPVAETAAPAVEAEADYKDVKFSGIRRAISKSMVNSLTSMAQLTLNTSFDASTVLNYRKALKAAGGDYAGITVGDILLFAVSRTVLAYPNLNANMVEENVVRQFNHVHLGVAVDTDRGLVVPTVFNADQKSLMEISKEVKVLAGLAREGKLTPEQMSGGSFTVSNLGASCVESFTPVINPPQTGILGVCTSTQRPRMGKDGGIELYPAMGLSLTIDHRVMDGGPASKFLKDLCANLENFTTLLSR